MLCRLGRWLRLFGYDVEFVPKGPDSGVVAAWRGSGRLLLTRDRQLAARCAGGSLLVESDRIGGQLAQVVAALRLDTESGIFTRCSVCNGPLRRAPDGDPGAAGVPGRVRELGLAVFVCSGCGRAYWEGTHTEKIRAEAARLMALTA